jgi:hypothetical protein
VCSQLVADAYAWAHVDLTGQLPARVTPGDLADAILTH